MSNEQNEKKIIFYDSCFGWQINREKYFYN